MAATTLKDAVIQALNKAANAFYSPQTLTPEQQEQARTNIGAMSAATSPSVPAGTLLPFAGTAVPDGYLLCNGANVSRTDYANLFAAIGTKWGEGDGSTTFTLPNFNDRFIEGTTDTEKVGQYLEAGAPNINDRFIEGTTDTEKVGQYLEAGAPNISGDSKNHAWRSYLTPSATGAFSVNTQGSGSNTTDAYNSYNLNFSADRYNNTYGKSETVQPDSAYTLIIIKE